MRIFTTCRALIWTTCSITVDFAEQSIRWNRQSAQNLCFPPKVHHCFHLMFVCWYCFNAFIWMNHLFCIVEVGMCHCFFCACVCVREKRRKQKNVSYGYPYDIECVVCSVKHSCYSFDSNFSFYFILFLFREESRVFIFARKLLVGGLFLMLNRHPNSKYLLNLYTNTLCTIG